MTPIEWIKESFVVIDAWQSLGFVQQILGTFGGRWIVIRRRHEEGMMWYLLTKIEFETKVKGQPTEKRVEDALQLREDLRSEVFFDRAPKESSRPVKIRALNSAERVVLLNSKTELVIGIGSLKPKSATTWGAGGRLKKVKVAQARKPTKTTTIKRPSARKAVARKAVVKRALPRDAAGGGTRINKKRMPALAFGNVSRPPAAAKNEPYTLVPVYFGTDRKQNLTKGKIAFGTLRDPDGELHLGRCHVAIPTAHTMGELESPKWYRLEFRKDPSKHLMLWDTQLLEPNDFYQDLRRQVRSSPEKDAFVFIHGFNVSFEDAVRRTGQMAHDLSFRGAAILFSWPSRGSINKYFADEATIESSIAHFQRFLDEVMRRSGAEAVHIIAHSMGNRALLRALQGLAVRKQKPRIHNVVLAAPDVDKQVFEQIAKAIYTLPKRITLYASSRDKAIRMSKKIHDAPRAGESGENLVVLPFLDTVDASNVDTDFLGHSYAMGDRFVLGDVFELLSKGTEPAKRYGLQKIAAALAGFYWEFRR